MMKTATAKGQKTAGFFSTTLSLDKCISIIACFFSLSGRRLARYEYFQAGKLQW